MAIAGMMILFAYNMYIKKATPVLEDAEINSPLHRLLWKKYGMDELYDNLFRKPIDALSAGLHHWVEQKMLLGMVDGSGNAAKGIGRILQPLHNGQIVTYLLAIIVGLIALIFAL
jgi:NADH-quinone oxidoreductase subunit L